MALSITIKGEKAQNLTDTEIWPFISLKNAFLYAFLKNATILCVLLFFKVFKKMNWKRFINMVEVHKRISWMCVYFLYAWYKCVTCKIVEAHL